jgi:CheY-like chemotaxis protein
VACNLVPDGVFVKRILIVEDNDLNRDALTRRLARHGYAVIEASGGADGLALAESERPDLILMDLGMPDVDGWECARRLKGSVRTASIPIIALSAHAMMGDRERALEAGCDDFDPKPIDFGALIRKLDRLLQPAVLAEET